MVKSEGIGRSFQPNVAGFGCVLPRHERKTGRRLDHTGTSNGDKHSAGIYGAKQLLHVERNFVEPANVGPDERSALRTGGNVGATVVRSGIAEWIGDAIGVGTARLKQHPMHVQYPFASGHFMQTINVLRADEHAITELFFELGQCNVRRIWETRGGVVAAGRVELPDQLRVATESLRRGHIFDAMAFPEAVLATERRDAAFRADASAGENEQAIVGTDQNGHGLSPAPDGPYLC